MEEGPKKEIFTSCQPGHDAENLLVQVLRLTIFYSTLRTNLLFTARASQVIMNIGHAVRLGGRINRFEVTVLFL